MLNIWCCKKKLFEEKLPYIYIDRIWIWMIPECVPDVINLKTIENPGENKNCNRCLEIRYEYRINNPDQVKETRGTTYFCQVCDYDIQWCHKAEHEKKHFIRKKMKTN